MTCTACDREQQMYLQAPEFRGVRGQIRNETMYLEMRSLGDLQSLVSAAPVANGVAWGLVAAGVGALIGWAAKGPTGALVGAGVGGVAGGGAGYAAGRWLVTSSTP